MYLKAGVLLLADVFERIINNCLEHYCLDSSHYFSSPGLHFDAMLEMTGIKLEKIQDNKVHLIVGKGIRGGISYISKRYSSIKNNNTVIYWDANNLYGWAMFQKMPYCDFKFLSEKEINKFNLNSINENSEIGYIY